MSAEKGEGSVSTTSDSNCSRVVRQSKYEHNDPSTRKWWDKKFKELEEEVAILPHEREDVIEEMFPEMHKKLKKILRFKKVSQDIPTYRVKSAKIWLQSLHSKHIPPAQRYGSESDHSLMTEYYEFPPEDQVNVAPRNNAFRKFFNTRADRAAIWKELPPLSLDEMDLTQKAQAITENIAQNFYEWLLSIGGDDLPTLDAATIIKMFEIGFNYHAAQSLCVKIKEMPAVTDAIATARRLPQASLRVNLHYHLQKDLTAFETKEKQIAFGKMLPLELRSMPPKEDFARKWLHCKRVPPELASMEAVWGGIENLRSTRAFCAWLVEHPEIPPPPYLVEKGMLSKKYLEGPLQSGEEDDIVVQPTSKSHVADNGT